MMTYEVRDELPPSKNPLRRLFRRNAAPETSIPYRNSMGRYETFSLDYSTVPSIIAATRKFEEENKKLFAKRDRKPWIRHGKRVWFEVWVGPAAEFERKPFRPATSFIIDGGLPGNRLEAALAPYMTRERLEREMTAAAEAKARIDALAADAVVLSRNTAIRRPLTLKA